MNSNTSLAAKAETTYNNPAPGCYIDESAGSADSCNRRTIVFAEIYGFDPGRPHRSDNDISAFFSDAADEAVDFLNNLEKRDGYCWLFDDNSLYLSFEADDEI